MTTRKRNSPGIEINEIDRSQYYNKPDFSTVGTTTFMCGFADKGTNYKTEWINSIKTLQDTYGTPANEVERYFYNSAIEILNTGGVLLTSKLPYFNKSKDNFAYVDYEVSPLLFDVKTANRLLSADSTINTNISCLSGLTANVITSNSMLSNYVNELNTIASLSTLSAFELNIHSFQQINSVVIENLLSVIKHSANLSDIYHACADCIEHMQNIASVNSTVEFYTNELAKADTTLTSFLSIDCLPPNSVDSNIVKPLISLDDFDKYKTHEKVIAPNTFRIVDITLKKYETIDMVSASSEVGSKYSNVKEEFIGIVPVVVSPMNALYFLQIIPDETITVADETSELYGSELTKNISAFNPVKDIKNRDAHSMSDYMNANTYDMNFLLQLSSCSINDLTMSKIAASFFPNINYVNSEFLDRKYLKSVGIVVFQAFKDIANNKKLNFSPVESFIGSLDRNARDPSTKASLFIDDIVNSKSNFINVFSNVKTATAAYKNASTMLVANLTAAVLGFLAEECTKNIDYSESIMKPLSKILDDNQDPNIVNIDIVCDAGVSNIALFAKAFGSAKLNDTTNIDTEYNADVYPNKWNSSNVDNLNWKLTDGNDNNAGWKAVLTKFDLFCKNTRRDCIFLADVLRPFCLDGNEKIVRSTNLKNTIENSILPNLKYIIHLNSSYSAGYCDWLYVQDYDTNEFFWLPPSAKAAGVCNYIDTYFHPWDAPAGIIRGRLNNVYDVAFSPRNDEAGKIYLNAWNYAVNYPIDGIVLEGLKTFLIEKTALDRINVRRLMLYLEKQVRSIARRFLYEGNTAYMRLRFVDTIKPIFENAKNSYGILDYAIRCDDTNNTQQTIDNNELRCAIAIKPVKTIEWIICDFIVTNLSANVREEVMKS